MSAPVGSLATEAALLLDAIAGRLESLRPGDGLGATAPEEVPAAGACPQCGHDPSAASACTACPLCRLIAVLRGERPETTARLVDGALTVVRALRALVPGPEGTVSPTTGPGSAAGDDGVGREDVDDRADGGADDHADGAAVGAGTPEAARADDATGVRSDAREAAEPDAPTGSHGSSGASGSAEASGSASGPRSASRSPSGGIERIVVR